MNLDLNTLYLTQLTTFTLMTFVMLLMGMRYQQKTALRIWGGAGILASSGMSLLVLRDVLPAWLSLQGGNMLLFAALGLTWSGCQALDKRRPQWAAMLGLLLLASLVLLWLPSSRAGVEARTMLYSVTYLGFHSLALHALCRNPQRRQLGYRLAIGLILLLQLLHTGRVFIASGHSMGSLLTAPSFVVLNFLIIIVEYAKILAFIYVCFESMELRLYHLAMRDPLTGLYNRRAFQERSEQRLQQTGQPVALLVMDLDHFKQVNDRYGHQAGDDVLVYFSRLLRNQLAPFDALYARSGGEEFLVLLSSGSADLAMLIAGNIRSALAASPILSSDGQLIGQTVSIGISRGLSGCGQLRQLIMAADMALYQAKQQGRNCVCSEEAQPQATSRRPALATGSGR